MAAGLAHVASPVPYVLPQLHAERFLFAGHVPSVVLQHLLWTDSERWYDRLVLGVKGAHQLVPLTLAFVLRLRRRALFYRYAVTLLTLSLAGALTFWLYPSAPPWAFLYPLAQCFAMVYTGNHYVVDLLVGSAYAVVAFVGVHVLWRRAGLPE